jgi:chromosome segregation ATPase
MYRFLIPYVFTYLILIASEPSAFGAGDINSKNPYGLNDTEKYIYNNKERIKSLKQKVSYLQTELEEIKSAIDGFRSLTQGSNKKVFDLKKELRKINNDLLLKDKNIANLVKKITLLEEKDKNIKLAITQLSSMIDNINETYVHKDELKKIVEELLKKVNSKLTKNIKRKKTKKISFKKMKSSKIFNSAKNDYKKRRFTSARTALEYLAKNRKYKVAETYYILGEI